MSVSSGSDPRAGAPHGGIGGAVGSPGAGAPRGPIGNAAGSPRGDAPTNIATAIADVSERATLLVREEIELAKAEVAEKAGRLARGAIVGVVAGVFFFTALFFVLVGCAWLLYYYLPIGNSYTYFYGFFAMALILLVLGLIAGLIAARAVRRGAPPTPDMAIEEARLIRETVSTPPPAPGPSGAGAPAPGSSAAGASPAPPTAGAPGSAPAPYGAAPGGGEGS